jgi:molybdate transport system substrate-binding protein
LRLTYPALAGLLVVVTVVVAGCSLDNRGPRNPISSLATPKTGEDQTSVRAGSVLTGAEPTEKPRRDIRIGAASDLRRVVTTLQPAIERACETKLTFVFGSSGQIKEQILAGADYHLFLSADTGFVEELERAGKLVPNGRATYGVGRIALAWRTGLSPLATVSDLTRADVKRISIANPGHAPYGRAAQEAMTTAGVWNDLHRTLVLGENIRQTTDYVQQGNVDAAIVALALVIDTEMPYTLIEATQHKPIIQGGGVVKGTGGELTARCALQQILDPAGQETLKRFGFEPVPAP